MSLNDYGSPTTHLTLLAGVRGGKEEAWTRFCLRYEPVVLQWCAQRGLQQADSEDVLQTLMKDAPSKLATYKREGDDGTIRRFRPWLRAVVGNLVADSHRDRARRPAGFGVGGDDRLSAFNLLTSQDADEIADVIASEYNSDLNRVVEAVRARLRSPNSWDVYRAKELDGQPAAQVAEAFKMEVGAVFVAVLRINRMLAEEYRKLFPEGSNPEPEEPHDLPG